MGRHDREKVPDRRGREGRAFLHDVGEEELSAGHRNAEGKSGALRSHKCQVCCHSKMRQRNHKVEWI